MRLFLITLALTVDFAVLLTGFLVVGVAFEIAFLGAALKVDFAVTGVAVAAGFLATTLRVGFDTLAVDFLEADFTEDFFATNFNAGLVAGEAVVLDAAFLMVGFVEALTFLVVVLVFRAGLALEVFAAGAVRLVADFLAEAFLDERFLPAVRFLVEVEVLPPVTTAKL
ncbi:MAG: hypothetical protein IT206_04500, partial [Fimbriimonadaceae bacterium]|nr:hypothetical protein [Fimbriimonadaceae bacterium]